MSTSTRPWADRCLGWPVAAIALAVAAAATTPSAHAAHAPGPIVLIGIDGMTFDLLDPLVADGRLPTFARLLDRGARAVLRSELPMRSPALWTTIATGQPRQRHGIYDFVTGSGYWPKSQRSATRTLVTANMRRAPALWQVASAAGRQSLVVGWLNTWPAERVVGAMVAPYVALGRREQTTIKGRISADRKSQTYPADLVPAIGRLVVPPEAVSDAAIARLVRAPRPDSPLFTAVPLLRRYLYTVRWSIAATETNTTITENLLAQFPDAALVMTYFDGADTLAHRFWAMRLPEPALKARLRAQGLDPTLAASLKARFGGAVDAYYELVDAAVGRLWTAAGADATVIVVSDHGWGDSPGNAAPHASVPFDGEHRLQGVFVACGPAVRHGSYPPLTQYDIAPTVLSLARIAVPEAMPGRTATAIVAVDPVAAPSIAHAESLAPSRDGPPSALTESPAFAEQELERLRSLGYVQ